MSRSLLDTSSLCGERVSGEGGREGEGVGGEGGREKGWVVREGGRKGEWREGVGGEGGREKGWVVRDAGVYVQLQYVYSTVSSHLETFPQYQLCSWMGRLEELWGGGGGGE